MPLNKDPDAAKFRGAFDEAMTATHSTGGVMILFDENGAHLSSHLEGEQKGIAASIMGKLTNRLIKEYLSENGGNEMN